MKTTFSIVPLLIAALMSVSPAAAQSTLPKEGGVAFSAVLHSTAQYRVSMGDALSQTSYEVSGGTVAEKAGSLGDQMSMRCVGSGRLVKGKPSGETGMCEYIDLSGDKVFTTYSVVGGETPGTFRTKHIIAGGTGKYSGIIGDWVGTRHPLWPLVEGQIMTVIVYKGSYKLP
jgi:hypothetical protein